MRGRPFAFLAVVTLGWAGARTAMLWPQGAAPVPGVARPVALADVAVDRFLPFALTGRFAPPPATAVLAAMPASGASHAPRALLPAPLTDARMLALFGLHFFDAPRGAVGRPLLAAAAQPLPPAPADPVGAAVSSAVAAPSRWSLSAWLTARPGGAETLLVPLLGASQAGVRVSYALDEDRRLALFGRVSAPLRHGGLEVAAGAQWRPTRAPVTAFVEARRQPRGAIVPAAGAFGGITATLPADFRLETYAQGGWVGGSRPTGFAEGQARAARRVAGGARLPVDVGLGAWGAVQRGAGRLDVGPSVSVTLPAGRASLRLALDWRQRVAGRAAPGSGPVLTLGAGF